MISLSAWWLALLAIPVLLLGEYLHRWIPALPRFNIPISVAGGLAVACVVAALPHLGGPLLTWQTQVSANAWTWWVIPEINWPVHPVLPLNLPLLVAFFTCIGLNANWPLLRKGSWPLILFLAVSTLLAVVQNIVGIGVAKALGESPLLGIMCGAVTLTGGHGTALGFAPAFAKAGLTSAASVGAAAATFGLVAGGLFGASAVTRLIERQRCAQPVGLPAADIKPAPFREKRRLPGFFQQVRAVAELGSPVWRHLLILAFCVKGGAWVSFGLQRAGLIFPAYMGAMLLGLVVRNLSDVLFPSAIQSNAIERIGTVLLGLFLSMTLMSLDLSDLASVAGPMLVILIIQIVVMLIFARWITWPAMGRDYEAAVMTAGHIGFGLGNTATAVADMDALIARYGPAPRAYTIVPPTGGFLIDLTNAVVILVFLNLFR